MLSRLQSRWLSDPPGWAGWLLARLWNRHNAALNDATLERLALTSIDRVLEVGFGGGYLLGRMAGVVTAGNLAGVDASEAMVSYCARRYLRLVEAGRLELTVGRAEALPHPDGRFTRACSVNSLFYWDDAPRAIAELWRVLAPGGKLVLCLTAPESLGTRGFARHGLTLYGADDVRCLLQGAGFHGIDLTRYADPRREPGFTRLLLAARRSQGGGAAGQPRAFWCATAHK